MCGIAVSWSVIAKVDIPAFSAFDSISSMVHVPSENIVCVCKSIILWHSFLINFIIFPRII